MDSILGCDVNLRFMKFHTLFLLVIAACTLFSTNALAQKAKFKIERSKCQKGRLPDHYVNPENRTYAVYAQGAYAANVEVPSRALYGWTRVAENPNLEVVVSLYGFRISSPQLQKENKQRTDKDGKVVETWVEYSYSGNAEGKASLYTYGVSEKFQFERKKTKSQLRREAAAAEKKEREKEQLSENAFLSADDVAEVEEKGSEAISEDKGLENTELPLNEVQGITVAQSVRTANHRSVAAASKQYRETELPKLQNFQGTFPMQAFNQAMDRLNAQYGYSPLTHTVMLKTLKSEKHPEFKMWNDACEAAATLLGTFRYHKSIEPMQVKFDPIIKYFSEQLESVPDDDAKTRNYKKAAFHNLITIMQMLDRHEQVMAICSKYLESKVLDETAERMSERSRRQAALLAFHKLDASHFYQLELEDVGDTDAFASEDEEEEEEEDEDSGR